jgi:tetratricopeptide (TPR) repeat protein
MTALMPSPAVMAAMMKLRQGDNASALQMAEEALAGAAADPVPLHAIAGLAAQRLEQPRRAVPHLEAILDANPDDTATRVNLANARLALGEIEAALQLAEGHDDPRLARIVGFARQQTGDLELAAQSYRQAIAADDNDLAAWNNLGNVLVQLGQHEEAIAAYERAITLAPADIPVYLNLAELLREKDRNEAGLKVLLDAETVEPDNRAVLVALGLVLARLDRTDEAIAKMKRAVDLSPAFHEAHVELGLLYENLNRVDELIALAATVDRSGAPQEANFLLAWAARRQGDFEEAGRLAALIPDTINPRRRFHLLGGIADRLGEYDTAFAAFEKMNRETLAMSVTRADRSFRQHVEDELAVWTDSWAGCRKAGQPTDGERDPIFLVGFPRSGTTLLDTMLMGQNELSVLEERPMMSRVAEKLDQRDLPAMSAETIAEARAAYFDSARAFGWDDGKWLVDKHPLNMQRLPSIHRIFPNARIIFAERHPYDVVFSCFMANFQLNFAMRSFTSLEEAALTYDAVLRAWERGNEMFALDVHPVRYEKLVQDSQAELRPLIDWLGLAWDDRVVDHQATAAERGRVRTASYSQIREELYTRASYRWRNYVDHLAPVLPILKPWAEKMGYPTV